MVEAFANSARHDSVFRKGLDNTNIKYIVDEISDSGTSHNLVEITDVYSKKYIQEHSNIISKLIRTLLIT